MLKSIGKLIYHDGDTTSNRSNDSHHYPMATSRSPPVDEDPVVDLEYYVREWALDCYRDSKLKGDPNTSDMDVKVDWRFVHFDYQDPFYETMKGFNVRSPSNMHSQVLLRTTYTNDTNKPQEYNFKAERTMRSTATVSVEKGFKTGKDVRLVLKAPEEIVEVSGGISREIEVRDLSEFTAEQELLWAIDSRVTTPPNCETCVKLVMNEAFASSPFYLKVFYRGRILAKLYNRTKGGAFHSTMQGELFDILDWATENKGLKGFNMKDERKGAFTEVTGRCNFKFGVEQKAHVTQRPLQAIDVRNLAIEET